MDKESAKAEYPELMQHIKFYASMRYAILAAFGALTGGIVSVVFRNPSCGSAKSVLKFGGAFISIACWVAEVSAAIIWAHFAKRATYLEGILDYRIYRAFPEIGALPVPEPEDSKARAAKLRVYWLMLLRQPTTLVLCGLYLLTAIGWIVAALFEW